MRRERWRLTAAIVALALLLGACGGDDGQKVAPTPAAAAGPWLALLDVVPDTAEARQLVVMNDYEAMRKLSSLEAPKDAAAVAEYRKTLLTTGNAAMPSHFSGLGRYFDPHLWSSQLGFHPGQVDADIQFGKPPNDVEAVRGRFDANAIDGAIDREMSPIRKLLTKTSREGATLYSWDEDNKQDLQNRSVLRPLGRGERLAVKGDTLFWAHATPPVNDAIDAAAGKKPSLADVDDVKTLLAGLTKHAPYTVLLSNEALTPDAMDVIGRDPSIVREARDASFKEALRPYTMLGIGYGQDGEGPFNVLVLLHASDALAQENVARLTAKIENGRSAQTQKPWKELITKYEVRAEGRLVTARMRTTTLTLLSDVFFKRDSLLVRE
jgi:hypothetical protein